MKGDNVNLIPCTRPVAGQEEDEGILLNGDNILWIEGADSEGVKMRVVMIGGDELILSDLGIEAPPRKPGIGSLVDSFVQSEEGVRARQRERL